MAIGKSPFNWDPEYYYVDKLKSMPFSEDALRREYAHLRKTLQNRMSRLRKKGYSTSGIEEYITEHLTATPQKALKVDLPYLIADTATILKRNTTTVAGREHYIKSSVQSLQDHSYDFVTASNFEDFGLFMQAWKDADMEGQYMSEQAAELYDTVYENGWNVEDVKKNFKFYMDNQQKLETFVPETKADQKAWNKAQTAAEFKRIMNKKKK